MAKKPTAEDAQLILKLYDLRRESEMRKARQWWLGTFWPGSAEDVLRVQAAAGTPENAWYRQVGGYWSMAANLVLKGAANPELFFDNSFCGEMYFIFAKIKPFLKELREKTQNPMMFGHIEKAIMSSSVAKKQFEMIEKRVAGMRAAQK
jgi:hypothetical protein